MRRLDRNSHIGMSGDFFEILKEISPYCFISDIETNTELYYTNNLQIFNNAYLIADDIVKALRNNELSESDILFFDTKFDLKKKLIYFDRDINRIGSSYDKVDALIRDLFEKRLKRTFSDAVENAVKETTKELLDLLLIKETLETKPLIENNDYIRFVKKFETFLIETQKKPLLSIRSTILLNTDSSEEIIEFIEKNICIADSSKQEKINNILNEYKNLIKNNSLLPNKRYFQKILEKTIKSYDYNISNIENKDLIPEEIIGILQYANILWHNPSNQNKSKARKNDFNWTISPIQLGDQFAKKILESGFHRFENFFCGSSLEENKDLFLELKRKICKAECFLKNEDYSNFVGQVQKFLEGYIYAIGGNINPDNNSRITSIKDKILNIENKILRIKQNELSITEFNFYKTVIDSVIISFNKDKLAEINSEYINIDSERNDFQHADIGTNKHLFNKYLNYLINEDLANDNKTGLFYKWKIFFEIPSENIFDQLNSKVLEFIKNPDLLNK